MKPGRELDYLIAGKVMGLEVRRKLSLDNGAETYWLPTSDRDIYGLPIDKPLPRYSTDIAAANDVLEKLQEDYYWTVKYSRVANSFIAMFFREYGEPTFEAAGETAQHAICRAALKAMRVTL